ncbi:hypothetical protein Pyn_02668 [Prunus yedoensis var. nudiflora]|uniref:Uncharacterized protein n=1 Tax=Prunus yedoensis var. nudiflora TaxID=2094558 RepID=A0A314ZLD8_PRUYE|nr:hypothetical protein Pyn_02668 [Prunus yedoensis var. nudiflora]
MISIFGVLVGVQYPVFDEAGIVPETELVLHVGEVTDRSMMDAAAEHKQKKGVMEVEVSDTD